MDTAKKLTDSDFFRAIRPLYGDDESAKIAVELSASEYRAVLALAESAPVALTDGYLHGFNRDDLAAMADGLDCEPQEIDGHETTTAAAAKFIRAALVASQPSDDAIRAKVLDQAKRIDWSAAQPAPVEAKALTDEQCEAIFRTVLEGVARHFGMSTDDLNPNLSMVRYGLIRAGAALSIPVQAQAVAVPTDEQIAEAMEFAFSDSSGFWPEGDVEVVRAWLRFGPGVLLAAAPTPKGEGNA